MFKNVVVLDEQMRQQQDIDYHQLLQRVRNGTITQADVDLLNTRVVSQLPAESEPGQKTACTVRRNKLRHTINRLQMERYARSRRQKIFIFPARHTMARSKHRSIVGTSRQFQDERPRSADVHAGHACGRAFQCLDTPRNCQRRAR